MKGYTDNENVMREHMESYSGRHKIHIVEIAKLQISMPGQGIMTISQTPHYQYVCGNKEPYKEWLIEHGHLYEESLASFEYLMNDDSYYLDLKHARDFIMHDDELIIVDGVHRATRLFQLGVLRAPALIRVIRYDRFHRPLDD